MKAVVLHEFGGPEVLRYEEVERPSPGPGEVLVQVHAVSVNQTLDLVIRQDGAGYNLDLPVVLGMDCAGLIAELGEGVEGFAVGDRVASIPRPPIGSSYAEYAVMRADRTYPMPGVLGFPEAAVVSRHFPMAYSLCRAAGVKAGDCVLVMGASGGLGSAAVQVVRHLGGRVIAGAGSDERVAVAKELGAEEGVNYRASDLTAEVKRLTAGEGVNAVFENISDPTTWPAAFQCLATGGTLVTVGAHGGGQVLLDVRTLYRKNLTVKSGLSYGQPNDCNEALRLAAAGEYRVRIAKVLPLSQASEAHRLAADVATDGKVVMDPTLG